MSVKRLSADEIAVESGDEATMQRFIESDFRIRSGVCPNGHGLMKLDQRMQECPLCGFMTNKLPDPVPAN